MVVVVYLFESDFFYPGCEDQFGDAVVDGTAGVAGMVFEFCHGDTGIFLYEAVHGLGTRISAGCTGSADEEAGECASAKKDEKYGGKFGDKYGGQTEGAAVCCDNGGVQISFQRGQAGYFYDWSVVIPEIFDVLVGRGYI